MEGHMQLGKGAGRSFADVRTCGRADAVVRTRLCGCADVRTRLCGCADVRTCGHSFVDKSAQTN
jgi:hypothetical protein